MRSPVFNELDQLIAEDWWYGQHKSKLASASGGQNMSAPEPVAATVAPSPRVCTPLAVARPRQRVGSTRVREYASDVDSFDDMTLVVSESINRGLSAERKSA